MKKILLTMVAALTAVTFTNCQKEEAFAPEQVGKPFELVASPETRTVNDGMATLWAAGDAVNVFHAVEGDTETFNNDGQFTLADVTTGTFTGTLTGNELTENNSYDWYMIYPYSSYIKTPANTSTGYEYIGCRSDKTQAQTGINSMAHIAGSNYPMIGKVEGVMGGEKPHITMNHASALVRVNVTNKNAKAINVTSIKLTAPESIVGTFYINFADIENVTYTDGDYVASDATLTVTDGVIEAGETASFYLAIKPINLENGNLTVSVATEGNDLFAKTFTGLTTAFSAGKIKTINVQHEAEAVEDYTGANFELVTDASTLAVGDKIVIAAADYDFAISTTQNSNNRGQAKITKQGDYIVAINSNVEVFTLEAGSIADSYAFKTANGYIYAASASSNYLRTETKLTDNSSWNISITDGIASIIAKGANTRNTMQYNLNSSLFACYNSASQKAVALYRYTTEDVAYIEVTPASLEWASDNTDTKSVTVKSYPAWEIDAATVPNWVTYSIEGNTLNITPTGVNEDMENDLTGTITLKNTTDNTKTAEILLTQFKAPQPSTGEVKTATVTLSEQGYANSEALSEIKIDENITATFAKNLGSTAPAYYTSGAAARLYGKNSLTIAGGTRITKITYTCASSYTLNGFTWSTGSSTEDSTTSYVWTPTETVNSVTVTNPNSSGHARIVSIVVEYEM